MTEVMEDDRPIYGPYLCMLDAKQLAVITLHSEWRSPFGKQQCSAGTNR